MENLILVACIPQHSADRALSLLSKIGMPPLALTKIGPHLTSICVPAHTTPLVRIIAAKIMAAPLHTPNLIDDYSGGHMPIDIDGNLLALSPQVTPWT